MENFVDKDLKLSIIDQDKKEIITFSFDTPFELLFKRGEKVIKMVCTNPSALKYSFEALQLSEMYTEQ